MVNGVRDQALSVGPWLNEKNHIDIVNFSIDINEVNIELNIHSSDNLSGNAVNFKNSKDWSIDFVGKGGLDCDFISTEVKEGLHVGVFQERVGVLGSKASNEGLSTDKSKSDKEDGFH